jgi:hypothetical protein
VSLQNKIKYGCLQCTPEQIATLKREGVLVFDGSQDQVGIWLNLRRGDVLIALAESISERLPCIVEARGFFRSESAENDEHVSVDSLAIKVTIKGVLVEYNSVRFFDQIRIGNYTIGVSQDSVQDKCVSKALNLHRYGHGSGFINLLIMKSGAVVGGALFDRYQSSMRNSTPSRNFEGYPQLCKDMYLVRRIVNSRPDIASSVHVQEIAFYFCELLCSFIADKDKVVLVGNSYDFMISALRRGFKCEIPSTHRHPIFYWKAVPRSRVNTILADSHDIRERYNTYKQRYRAYKNGPVSFHFRPSIKAGLRRAAPIKVHRP